MFKLTLQTVPEDEIQNGIITAALQHPAVRWVLRINSGGFHRGRSYFWFYRLFRPQRQPETKGFPDLLIGLNDGRCLAVEVKRPGGKLRPAQADFVHYLLAQGLPVCVAHGWAEALSCLEGMAGPSPGGLLADGGEHGIK